MPYFGIPIRNGLPIGLGSVAGFGIAPFEPYSLFENGEQGAWYDPSDLTTLFQDSAGTTPVTGVEQFVGLMLDKSKGLVLGPELVTPAANRDFSSDTGYWTKTIGVTITGGQCVYSSVTSLGGIYRSGFVTAGVFYEVTFTIASISAGAIRVYAGGNRTANVTTPGTYTQRVCAGSVDTLLIFENFGTTTLALDDVSVKIVTGNHATQTTSAKRPKLAARYNLLEYSEQFNDAYWTNNSSITENTAVAPDGTTTADTLTSNGTINSLGRSISATSGLSYTVSVSLKYTNNQWFLLQLSDSGTTHRARAWFDIQNGVLGTTATTGSGVVISRAIVPEGNGWYRCTLTATNPVTTLFFYPQLVGADGSTTAAANLQSCYIWGADLRPASQATGLIGPTYQRVVDAATYDTAGFLPYLEFLVDDSMYLANNALDALEPSNQPFAMWAGVRRNTTSYMTVFGAADNTDATAGNNDYVLLDLDVATNQGRGALRDFSGSSTDKNAVAGTLGAPSTFVQTWNRSSTTGVARVNGVAGTAIDQTLPALSLALYTIGSRRRGSGPTEDAYLNGQLYSLIVRAAATTQSQIEATEAWVNQRTGAF
jgi:hypothetical protein